MTALGALAESHEVRWEQALTVSPFDIYGTAEAMRRALTLACAERQQRAAVLCDKVRHAGVKQ